MKVYFKNMLWTLKMRVKEMKNIKAHLKEWLLALKIICISALGLALAAFLAGIIYPVVSYNKDSEEFAREVTENPEPEAVWPCAGELACADYIFQSTDS